MDKKKGTKSKGIYRKRPKPKGKGTPYKKAFKPEDRDRRVMFGGGAGGSGPKGKAKFLTHGMKKFSNPNRPGTPGAGGVRLTNEEATKRKMMAERMQSRLALGLRGERTRGQVLRSMYSQGTNRDDMPFQNLTIGEQFGVLGIDKFNSGRLFGVNADPMPYQRNTATETATAPDIELRPEPAPMLVQPPENPMGQGGVQMQPGGHQDKESAEGPYFQDAGPEGGYPRPRPAPDLGAREERMYGGLDEERDDHIMMPRGPDEPVVDQNLDVPPPQEVGESARFRRAPRETNEPQQQQQTQETPTGEDIEQGDPFHVGDTMSSPEDYRREKLEEKERDAIIQDHVQDTVNDMITDLELEEGMERSGLGVTEDSGLTPLLDDEPDYGKVLRSREARDLNQQRRREMRERQERDDRLQRQTDTLLKEEDDYYEQQRQLVPRIEEEDADAEVRDTMDAMIANVETGDRIERRQRFNLAEEAANRGRVLTEEREQRGRTQRIRDLIEQADALNQQYAEEFAPSSPESDPSIFQGATELYTDARNALFDAGTQARDALVEAGSQFGDMLQIGVPVSPNTIQSNPDPIEGAGAGAGDMVSTPRLLAPKDDPPEESSSESDQGGYVVRAGRKVFYHKDPVTGDPLDPISGVNQKDFMTKEELSSWRASTGQRKRHQAKRKSKRRKARREGKPPHSPKHKRDDEIRKKERAERRRKKEQAKKRKEFSRQDREGRGGSGGPVDV